MIDVRCTSSLPSRFNEPARRCQLLAGHEGDHAVMFCRGGRRTIRRWRDHDPTSLHDHPADQPNLPWVLGMPQPVWMEST